MSQLTLKRICASGAEKRKRQKAIKAEQNKLPKVYSFFVLATSHNVDKSNIKHYCLFDKEIYHGRCNINTAQKTFMV